MNPSIANPLTEDEIRDLREAISKAITAHLESTGRTGCVDEIAVLSPDSDGDQVVIVDLLVGKKR
jgi:hypothetical protein